MTTDYIFKDTVEVLANEFPELSEQLPSTNGEIYDVLEFKAPKSGMVMKLFLSDRMNVRWKQDSLKLGGTEGVFVGEVEVIRKVLSEKSIFAIYQTDLELASEHNFEIPEGISTRPISQLISKEAISESNSEYDYDNKITLVSWLGPINKEFYAPYQ